MQKQIKVLIVDDNERARKALRALLAVREAPGPGIAIAGEAADGREAVERARELEPDVVLMDAQMPHMDGLEATRQIKARWPEIRVVVVTMYAPRRGQAVAAGADAFLRKGGPVEELLSAILGNDSPAREQSVISEEEK